jgi:hypothetical protein
MTAQACSYCGAKWVPGDPKRWFCGTSIATPYVKSTGCRDRQIEQLQARIDELMFEHCPDEMTREQIERYTNAQRIVEE